MELTRTPRNRRALSRLMLASFETLENRRHLSTSKAGAIDQAFGTHGVGSISIPGGGWVNVTDVATARDGKIIIVGSAGTYTPGSTIGWTDSAGTTPSDTKLIAPVTEVSQKMVIARLNADGTPDNSFNGDGFVLADFNSTDAEATRVVLTGDQILVAGDANGNFALARFNSDGSPDTHFGTNGTATVDFGADDDKAWGLDLQSNGKIVAAGQSAGQVAIARLNADGTLDGSFGTGGKTLTTAPGATAVTAADGTGASLDGSGGVHVLGDGRVLVVSNETETDYTGRVDFLYYDASGSLAAIDHGAAEDYPPNVVDFAVLGGSKVITFSSDNSQLVQRYNADATLDTSFGDHGTVASPADGGLDWGGYGTLQSDGKILIAGSSSVGWNEGAGVARYNADGSVDNSFGQGGRVTSVNAGYSAAAVAVDSSGRIVAVGTGYDGNNPTLTAARFLPNVGVSTPTVQLVSAPDLTHSGNKQFIVSVRYDSAAGIDPNTLEDGNLTVTRTGIADANDLPTFYVDQTVNKDGSITVRYAVQKDYAGHYFDALDDGTYKVSISEGAVFDYNGVPVPSTKLGSLDIDIPVPPGGISAPTASLGKSDITTVNVTDGSINVIFDASLGLDANSLGGGITVTGPNDYSEYGWYDHYKVNADGTITATYTFQHDGEHTAFTAADNGTYSVEIDSGAVMDLDGNELVGGKIGTFKVNVPAVAPGQTPATATLKASDLTDANADGETLTVTYTGPAAIAANTLDDYDLKVTNSDGSTATARFQNATVNNDGSTTATYFIPVGYGDVYPLASASAKATPKIASDAIIDKPIIWWGGLSNGTYTVSLVANQVNDTRGVAAAAATLGTFTVKLPPRPYPTPGPLYLTAADGTAKTTTAHSTATSKSTAIPESDRTPKRAHVGVKKHKKHHKHKKHKATKNS